METSFSEEELLEAIDRSLSSSEDDFEQVDQDDAEEATEAEVKKDSEKQDEKQDPEPEPEPMKSLNILILGETGVGKSTWINAFANFVHYESLDEAEANDLLSAIPGHFTVCDADFNEITVTTGSDINEAETVGQSATQNAKVYEFLYDQKIIRLIDTPGIGDTRGVLQDKQNLQNILSTIDQFHELHGICILLKPNSSKLNVMFRFCIKELLTYLHRDASKNIMFCFTNSRGTFYRPGDTMPPLRILLAENKDVHIETKRDTVYCFDSEAYRFLAAIKNNPPVTFSSNEKENFATSWRTSMNETKRMLNYIESLQPHPIQNTVNLNHTREMILKMTRPLAEISRNIHTNKAIVEDEERDIVKTNENIKDLKAKRMTVRTEIEVTQLDYPMTVCANSNCVTIWTIDGIKTTEFLSVCHDHCNLGKHVHRDTIGDPALMKCSAMRNGFCENPQCGHNYREHLHIYYQSKQVPKRVEDEAVKEALQKNLSAAEMKQKMLEGKKKQIAEYEDELGEIREASAIFACFLKNNAITPYNDAMEEYLDHLISDEKDKVGHGGSRVVLERLKQSKAEYIQKKNCLEEALTRGENITLMTSDEVKKKVEKLKSLRLSGDDLKRALDCVTRTAQMSHQSQILHYNPGHRQCRRHQQPHPLENIRGHWKRMVVSVTRFWKS